MARNQVTKNVAFYSGLHGWAHSHNYPKNIEVISSLLQRTDINIRGISENTPLHCACKYGDNKVAILLIKEGADIHVKNVNENTALHKACFCDGYTTDTASGIKCPNNKKEVVALLIQGGVDINSKNKNGDTALHNICRQSFVSDRKEIVILIIENGGSRKTVQIDHTSRLNL